jgi:hypothetical protein
MKFGGIGFNEQWVADHTEKQFIDQHLTAFDESDHPIAKMAVAEKRKFLKEAYKFCKQAINGRIGSTDTAV